MDGLKLSQAWFDDYYTTKYQTDDKPYSDARLASLADCIARQQPKSTLDIGGMDGELQNYLALRSVPCDIAGVGDVETKQYEAVILSHTLEHIYDIGAMFERIENAITQGGHLFIEVPVHLGYQPPKDYDLHWQHINKFRAGDLERLCTQKGYEVVISEQIADYREYQVWRIVGRHG